MTQWEKLLRLDVTLQSRVRRLYEGKLHRDVRSTLSSWIENQDWDSVAADENTARTCFNTLLVYVEEQFNRSIQEKTFLQGPDFSWMKCYLMETFEDEPLKLAVLLSECLKEEKKILASEEKPQGGVDLAVEQNWYKLDGQVNKLKDLTTELRKEMDALQDLNEKLDYIQKTFDSEVKQHVELAQSFPALEEKCKMKATFITQTKQSLLKQVVNILKQTEQTLAVLIDEELPGWKRRQQLACIGSPENTDLQHLQKWFTSVAEVLLGVCEQLQKMQDQNQRYNNLDSSATPIMMAEINAFAGSLLTTLLTSALVVEKQPAMQSSPNRCLILKTNIRFEVTVRFLVNLPQLKYHLTVQPVFDKDVEEVKKPRRFRLFEFTSDDSKVLDVDSAGGGLMAVFRNMSVKEKTSRSRRSNENPVTVTEELHVIKFVTTVQLNGLKCEVEATSLPVVVISSTNQVPSAWASIMWWNMLSSSQPWNLSLFADPPPLSWESLSQVLSWQFLSVGQRGLDEHQLAMLRDKIVDNSEGLVHWNKFSRNEDAWIWIDGILDLIKKYLLDLWRDGSIMGFVSRGRTQSLLRKKLPGTFLLRFSESNKDGAITFSWVHKSGDDRRVLAVDPYTKSELSALSLPNIIYHYSLSSERKTRNPLLYLYPDIPKDRAFKRYYKSTETLASGNGYMHWNLVSTSIDPSPPPSPPEMAIDTETDMETETDHQQVVAELFSSLLDSPGPEQWWTSYQDSHPTHTLSPLSDFTGSYRPF